jgi:hypothetical protein
MFKSKEKGKRKREKAGYKTKGGIFFPRPGKNEVFSCRDDLEELLLDEIGHQVGFIDGQHRQLCFYRVVRDKTNDVNVSGAGHIIMIGTSADNQLGIRHLLVPLNQHYVHAGDIFLNDGV